MDDNSDKKSMTVSLYLKYDTDLDIIEAVRKQKNVSEFIRKCIRQYLTGDNKEDSEVIRRLKAIEKKLDKLKNVTVALPQSETEPEKNNEIERIENELSEAWK